MTDTDLNQTTQTSMATAVPNYSVKAAIIDEASNGKGESYWYFNDWSKKLGYLKNIPEYLQAVKALAIWTCGKGWDADAHTKVILNHITGWGEDSFDSIMQNMIIVKKANGDAFAEAIREPDEPTGMLINLKPLNPYNMRVVVDDNNILLGYDFRQKNGEYKRLAPWRIFHLVNDRIASEIHGVSVIDSCQWVIDAKNEAMSDWRRILHRSSIRVMYVDVDDTTRLTTIKSQYASAIKAGELMLIPAKRTEAEFEDLVAPPVASFLEWINYLDNFFYQAVGVPKVTTGGAMDYTEAAAKVGYLTFEQPYMTEQRLLEQDLWNQLTIKVEFNRPVSLKDSIQSSEAANTGQMGMQPQDMQASMTRGA